MVEGSFLFRFVVSCVEGVGIKRTILSGLRCRYKCSNNEVVHNVTGVLFCGFIVGC